MCKIVLENVAVKRFANVIKRSASLDNLIFITVKGIEIDYDRMFDLLILGPMNRIVEAMGKQPISLDMAFERSLW